LQGLWHLWEKAETMSLQESDDLYRITELDDILRLMRSIQRERQLVVITLPSGQKILTTLLNIDEDLHNFVYDVGRDRQETQTVLSTSRVHFSTNLGGVSINLTAPPPVETVFDGSPAFLSPLPLKMQHIQRREYFRTKAHPSYLLSARLTDGTAVSLNLRDLSFTGAGLQSTTIPPERLPVGTLLRDTVLDFLELGKVDGITLMVTSHQKVMDKGLPTYLYGCRFEQLPQNKDTILQRLVFSLEQLNRAQARDKNRD